MRWQRAAVRCGETLSGRKTQRSGTGAIRREFLINSRLSAPQVRCMRHLTCPDRRIFRPLSVSNRIGQMPAASARSGASAVSESVGGRGKAAGCDIAGGHKSAVSADARRTRTAPPRDGFCQCRREKKGSRLVELLCRLPVFPWTDWRFRVIRCLWG